jgi:tRNA-specific 2-thiouridylase
LYTAPKKDSQGLCFVGDISFKDLLKSELHPESGNVLNEDSEIIGIHDGAILYTIGERHGFTINKKTPNDEALFVVSKNIEKNTITVSNIKPELLEKSEIELESFNNILNRPIEPKILVRFRYRQNLIDADFIQDGENIRLVLNEKALPVIGQSAVIYDKTGKKVLGGGIIS